MARRLTHTTALVLQAVAQGYRYGFEIMQITGLPSGTIYPALRRLDDQRLVASRWEDPRAAHRAQRPARKYYELRPSGRAALDEALVRFRHLEGIAPAPAPVSRPEPA